MLNTTILAMAELLERLEHSLGATYSFERELDGAGMSRVFVAQERALGRTVVVKVLAPDLAVALNRERFQREILFAAQLQHPHIVPVLSAGDTQGLPYYTMPFVEGESLRDRIAGHSRMPLYEVVRILREIAEALAYAHARGIVHRDIKPDNVLLADGHALVTDFGVAKAVSDSTPEERAKTLTHPGITLGTPAYMAPEQSLGDRVDQRADLYSFGCLAYELLTGEGPFPHPTAHRLVTAHLIEPPPPIIERRPDIPAALADLVMQCLEKTPDKRPPSARAVVDDLDAIAAGAPRSRRRRVRRGWMVAALAVGIAIVATMASSWRDAPLDMDVIAVLPFRVTGADASIAPLREGMIDLLDAKFVGSARVVDPRSMLAAWSRQGGSDSVDLDEDDALRLARRFGAGQVLLGSVSGGGEGKPVVLTAALRDVNRGSTRQATVEGLQDSLPALVDRLVAQLLALRAGQDVRSIASLADISFAALRDYITAQAASRRGRFEDAIPHYRAAIARDSGFALAGMGLALSVGWLDAGDWNEGWRVAWRGRDRLSAGDRAILEAWVGKAYPAWPAKAELRALAEHAVRVASHKPEAWYALGDNLYHFGALQGLDHAPARALTALNRAVALDSSYGFAVQHLPDLYVRAGDGANARRAIEQLLSLDSTSRYGTFGLWFAGVALGDRDRHERAMAALEHTISASVSVDLAQSAMVSGFGYDDAEHLLTRLVRQGATEDERTQAALWLYQLEVARGRPKLAAALLDGVRLVPTMLPLAYEDGDSVRIGRSPRDGALSQCTTDCALAGLVREVLTAARSRRADLRVLTLRLDSLLRSAPEGPLMTLMTGNITVAHAFEQLGEPERALNAVRRRPVLYGPLLGWATMLRTEGRLAAQLGDREGAIRAYHLFIALRAEAEPALQDEVEHARAELSRLQRELASSNR